MPTALNALKMKGIKHFAPVAQLDRASDFESAGRPFESGRAYQIKDRYKAKGTRYKEKIKSLKLKP